MQASYSLLLISHVKNDKTAAYKKFANFKISHGWSKNVR